MKRVDVRAWAFGIVAALAVAAFLRLGTWQLDRLAERRASNLDRIALAALPPLDLAAHRPPTDSLLWRRVRLSGTWDYEKELVIRGRAAMGTPGVHLLTPLRLEDGLAVLVLRGWLPAADGLSADLVAARAIPADGGPATAVVTGRVLRGEPSAVTPPRLTRFEVGVHLVLGSIDLEVALADFEGPVLDAWVLPDSIAGPETSAAPRLVEPPAPSDGPHLMYAIQWFGFATITTAGAFVFLRSRKRDDRERTD
jgi:surfeit locus 1 family protein